MMCGSLTHALIARMLARESYPGGDPAAFEDAILLEARELLAANRSLGTHRARSHIRIVTAAGQYLHRYRPGPAATFYGSEVTLGQGRVDLLWHHPSVGVFADEVKTTRHTTADLPASHVDQVARYARDGWYRFGTGFAGVRYLPLLHPSSARWVSVDVDEHAHEVDGGQVGVVVRPLAGSPLDVTALREVS